MKNIEKLVESFQGLQKTWRSMGAEDTEPRELFQHRMGLWLRGHSDDAIRDMLDSNNTWSLYEDPNDWKINLELTIKFVEIATLIKLRPQDKIIQAAVFYGWDI